jgi:hypothetical protein
VPTRLPDRTDRIRRTAEPPQIAEVAVALGSLLLVVWSLLALNVIGGGRPADSLLRHGDYTPFEFSNTAPY